MGKSRVPEIRFCGFTDDWKQRTLGEVIEDYIERTTIQNQYPVLTSSQQKGIMLQEDYFANRQVTVDENIGYFILPRGYFTYRSRSDNDVFVFNRNDLIDKGIISYFYPVFSVKEVNSDFFLRRINNGIEHQIAIAAEGTGQHVLSLNKFKNIFAMFPALEEQTAIGNFFRTLDDTITLHKQELDLLKLMKQGFLQKMFPKEGQTVPEIRFPGFTDDWIEQTLYDMADNIDYGLNAAAINYDGMHKYIRITDIDDITRDFVFDSLTSPDIDYLEAESYILKPGDILFARTGASTGKSYIYKSEDGLVYFAGFLIRAQIKAEHNAEFVFQNTLTENYNNYIKVTSQRSGQPGVNAKEYGKFKLMAPSLTEQIVIGRFFRQIDCLIKDNQQELELLKETKKAFLQKMFI